MPRTLFLGRKECRRQSWFVPYGILSSSGMFVFQSTMESMTIKFNEVPESLG